MDTASKKSKEEVIKERNKKKKKKRNILIYEYCICVLALMGTILAVIDINQGLTLWQIWLDRGILIVLTIDYLVRFILAKDKRIFFIENVFNLLAIFPFSSTLRVLRITRLTKLFKLSIIGAFPRKAFRKVNLFLNTNGLKNMLFFTVVAILFGSVGIMYTEHMTITDSLWWAFVTATTVGYGDLSPSTNLGRLIAAVLMIFGIGLIGSITSTITSYFLNLEKKDFKEETITSIKNRLDDISNLSDEEIDSICKVLKTLNKNK
ncbi:potassium channel family protein [Anaerocolumna sp.]|uniref:potassium channel family protein n=1 Tax=Anaerocolumna sp. TaxID=2041569 RepID=UPI0028A7D418|nr:ion channel [Anaerocolumna sp.]